MLSLCNPTTKLLLKTLPLSISLVNHHHPPPPISCLPPPRPFRTICCSSSSSASSAQIDMIRSKDGVYAPKPKKVVVLWDLDNKPPCGPPYDAAMALKRLAQALGEVVDMSAYANRHAFIHLPQWVVEERRQRRRLDILEKKGVATPSHPYICGVCGRKFNTNLDLKKHFRQLHERERQKKMNRLNSLKGKKRQKFKERYIDGNHKYQDTAMTLITPKSGYGLASQLRKAGVFVKMVQDKPQAADWALKRQMQHSFTRGIDWLVLVSDDSDFRQMLDKAREANLGTVVVGDVGRALGRHADIWLPWIAVQNGEVTQNDMVPRRRDDYDNICAYSDVGFDADRDMDSVLDELVGVRTKFNELSISSFSDGEDEEWSRVGESVDFSDDYLLDSDDEETDRNYRKDESPIIHNCNCSICQKSKPYKAITHTTDGTEHRFEESKEGLFSVLQSR